SSEQITECKEMAPFTDILSKAEDLYMPSGPPMSPLTISYFTCWAFFDACAGAASETIGTITLELGAVFGMPTELMSVIRLMQESRRRLFVREGMPGCLVVLRDLLTATVPRAISR